MQQHVLIIILQDIPQFHNIPFIPAQPQIYIIIPEVIIIIVPRRTVPVKMGKDADGTAYVWIGDNSYYYGLAVLDVVGAGGSAQEWNEGWEIQHSDDCPDVTLSKTVYPNATVDQLPVSLPANGGNADTVDNRHADEFMYIQGNDSPSLDGIPTTFAAGLIKNHVPGIEYNAILQAYDFGGNYLQLLLKGMGEGERVSFRSSVNNRWRDLAFADNLIMEDKSGSIMAANTVMNMHGFGYQRNGFATNGSFISFGGIGNAYHTQIQGDYINGNLHFRTYNSDGDTLSFHPWKKVATTQDLDQKADKNHTHSGVTTMKAMYEFTVIGSKIEMIKKKGSYIVTDSVRDGGGRYTINHNLGHDNYVVILGTGRREGSDLIVKAGLIEQNAACFRVQTSVGDQFRDGGFYATILTF